MHRTARRARRPLAWRSLLACALLACALLALLPRARAVAQPADAPPLRLAELYAQVQRASPRVAAARALARAAAARVPAATRPPDPQLQLGFMNYSVPGLAPMAPLGMTQLQLMQMLPLGGKLTLAGRAAAAQAAAASARSDDVSWELRGRTAMAFYDLYATDRGLDVARQTLRVLQDVARTAESMYRVGEGRQADVLRARVEIARMAQDTVRMQAMRQTMVARLDALLGGEDRDDGAAAGTPVLPRFPDTVPARAWLDSVALAARPMLQAARSDVRAADAGERLARRELVPDVQLGVQYAQRGGEMRTERMASLMLGASVPIFAGARQLQMRREAGAMAQMARADLAAMRAETRGKVGEAYAALSSARELAQLYRTTVLPQAEATVASALAAYRVGGVDFMTLLDDRMTVNRYRQELAVLDADQGKAWAELEMLLGRPLFDVHVVAPTVATGGAR